MNVNENAASLIAVVSNGKRDIIQRALAYARARSDDAEVLMRRDPGGNVYQAGKSDAYDDMAVYLNGMLLEMS
jgi:hypothetical protein